MKLLLASGSPRRLELLARIGVTPNLVAAVDLDETPLTNETPRELAKRLCLAKGQAADLRGYDVALSADTVVGVGRRILGKPQDEAQARQFLELLSGRAHRVWTGIALTLAGGEQVHRVVGTRLQFKQLSNAEINSYLAGGDWRGKAGGYGIQGMAEMFVRSLNGSYSNVMGLPLHETYLLLNGVGYPVLAQ
ncbi:Septum formation protein Maf [hydrothermal vent metagenome]|uniref:Septum formation protein Maf n=1 Tax=hydrothermal vent metagenome TaxID=652676 RepID=A0A3B0REQ8_9ZZZZ